MIVIHHKGDAEKLFRGSSAIQNQCDATVTNAILAALPSQTKQEVADKIGRREDDPTFRAAWKGLRDTERLSKTVVGFPRENHHHPPARRGGRR